jgi:hypothetical protein
MTMSAIPACPECERLNQKSRVYPGGSSTTLLGGNFYFRDEDGVTHHHDPNRIRDSYRCSKGHLWEESYIQPCHSCDWAKKLTLAGA